MAWLGLLGWVADLSGLLVALALQVLAPSLFNEIREAIGTRGYWNWFPVILTNLRFGAETIGLALLAANVILLAVSGLAVLLLWRDRTTARSVLLLIAAFLTLATVPLFFVGPALMLVAAIISLLRGR